MAADDKQYQNLVRYCAYAERCSSDVRKKARQLGMSEHDIEDALAQLIEERYLDDARYALSYTYGKVTYHGWGPLKIQHALFMKHLPQQIIDKALSSIAQEEWDDELNRALQQRLRRLLEDKDRFAKLVRHGQQRGYPLEQVIRLVNKMLEEDIS